MSVIDLDGKYVADTHDESNAGKLFPYPDLVRRASQFGRTSGIRMMGAKPYQAVVVPARQQYSHSASEGRRIRSFSAMSLASRRSLVARSQN